MTRPKKQMPLGIALGFEAFLGALAISLALIFGLAPWLDMQPTLSAIVLGVLTTLPLLASMLLIAHSQWQWASALDRLVRDVVATLFAKSSRSAIVLVSLMAGLCEELLFRGVIQGGLAQLIGPWWALALASLLFGLAHALSKAYFVVTTLAGLYFGWLYLWTGSLMVPIIAHALYDWAALEYYLKEHRRGESNHG